MDNIMPFTATTTDIQKSYRQVFNKAKKFGPIVILTNNKPDVVIISIEELQKLRLQQQKFEIEDTLSAIASYQKDKKQNKLIKTNSLADLI